MAKLHLRTVLGIEIPTIEVVDVDAMVEGTERYAGLVEQGIARVTGFEPDPPELEKLKARTGPYRYLPYVLGRGEPGRLHITRYPGCSSLYEPNPAVTNAFVSIGAEPGGNFQAVRTAEVETRRLDDVPGSRAADCLKVDV